MGSLPSVPDAFMEKKDTYTSTYIFTFLCSNKGTSRIISLNLELGKGCVYNKSRSCSIFVCLPVHALPLKTGK